jgi:hypothetical protein
MRDHSYQIGGYCTSRTQKKRGGLTPPRGACCNSYTETGQYCSSNGKNGDLEQFRKVTIVARPLRVKLRSPGRTTKRSASPLTSDIVNAGGHVAKVPSAEVRTRIRWHALFAVRPIRLYCGSVVHEEYGLRNACQLSSLRSRRRSPL